MRLQDELIALHAIADAPTRAYVVGQVPRLPVHFDSAELADLLERGFADSERTVAVRALVSWHRIGPQLTLHAHGLDPGRAGLWSTVALKLAGGAPGPVSEEIPPDALAQRAGLAAVLEPCRSAVLALAARPGPDGDVARQVLGLLPFEGSEEVLVAGAADPARAVGALLALARRDPRLAGRTTGGLKRLPPWLLASVAGALGDRTGLALAMDAAKTGEEHACWAAADSLPELAAGPAGVAGAAEVARAVALRRFGWAPAVLADALGQLAPRASAPVPADSPVIAVLDGLLTSASHDLVRILAVRAMGGFRHDLSQRRATKCLEKGSPHLQAAAIEALVRLDHRPPELKGQLLERASKATALKLRGTALLGLMTHDRQTALRGAVDLVGASEPAARVEGAYALGYLQSRTSVKLLNLVAHKDPFVPSALQAVKSLAHYPEEQVAPVLIELLAHREPAVALAALRVLSHFPGDNQVKLLPALEALEKRSQPAAFREVLVECGRLGESVKGLTELLARPRTDAVLRAGAMTGLSRTGVPPVELARAAAADAAAEIAVPGAIALIAAGDAAGAATLAKWLADARAAPAAVRAVRNLAVVAGEAGRGGRFLKLQKLVGGKKPTTRKVPSMAATLELEPVVARGPTPVGVKDDDPLLQTLADGNAVIEKVTGLLVKLNTERRGTPKKEKTWARELTYLHGPQSLWQRIEPYKALFPAVAIVGAVVLFFVQQTAMNIVSPEVSVAVKRDAVLGKAGTRVDLQGRVTEVNAEKKWLLLVTTAKVTVKVILPGVDMKGVKSGSSVAITGLVKEPRTDPVVVHGFTLKDE